ncbi:MAG TPA: ATP-binding cassette domain-containing protein [Acetobacteraceae bacterium]|nr:ATP-binding cassette domain-containing protein [Acetobacteraceae bacterium]
MGHDELFVRIATKSYRDPAGRRREVLREVAFTGRGGEILALLAPSGSGKTTILRIVLGLDRDFDGDVRRPPGPLGVMFQEPRLLPWLTVAANLRLVPGGHEREITGLLAEVGLAGAETLHPRALSLGMARRVALVRALLGKPSLLVLDEPFASLDPQAASALASLLVQAARRDGALILLSTHDLDQVLGFADRLLVLAGTPARLAADCPTGLAAHSPGMPAKGGFKEKLLLRFPFLSAAPAPQDAS